MIEKPKWTGTTENGVVFEKTAKDTLTPDIISLVKTPTGVQFIIFDAKYYNLTLEKNKALSGQPGIESITKQYLYQRAYQQFIEQHGITEVRNCFLMPTESSVVVNKGTASLGILSSLGLQDIQIRLLPANDIFSHYIANKKYDIGLLKL